MCRVNSSFRWRQRGLALTGILCLLPCGAVSAEPAVYEAIAPGVWRVRLGEPERHTPVSLHRHKPRADAMAALPTCAAPPLDSAVITFRVSDRGSVLELPLDSSEQVYGFGLHLPSFNCTETAKSIIVNDHQQDLDGSSHAPVPFYVTTRGYGVLVDTFRNARFYGGNLKKVGAKASCMTVDVPTARGVDVYLFGGPALKDAVCRYNLFSGGGCLPPLWGLGVYYRSYGPFKADDVLKLARYFREKHIPVGVYGLEPGWHSQSYSCSYVWSNERWPDPDGFIKQMLGLGYQLNLWEHAFVHPTSPLYEPLKPFAGEYEVWKGLVPDFVLPEARRIYGDYHEREFIKKGVTGFKLDECDNQPHKADPWTFPELSRFPSGLDGEQMHLAFPLGYQRTLEDAFRRNNLRTYGKVRASGPLAAPLPFVLYSDAYDHRAYVRGLLNMGFCGLLWQPEVRNCASLEDLYRRTLTAMLSPQGVINAWFLPNPPWMQIDQGKNKKNELMPERDEAERTIRGLLELRMRLVPYLYAAFADYRASGLPPFRALVMDWPADAKTYRLDDEYMVGDSLLVAAMFNQQRKRTVYLPEGGWYCFWTHRKYEGGREHMVEMPPDRIPLFVRAGTLLPLAQPVEFIGPDTVFDILVQAYGEPCRPARLIEDDGRTLDFEKGASTTLTITWSAAEGLHLQRRGAYKADRYKIEANVERVD